MEEASIVVGWGGRSWKLKSKVAAGAARLRKNNRTTNNGTVCAWKHVLTVIVGVLLLLLNKDSESAHWENVFPQKQLNLFGSNQHFTYHRKPLSICTIHELRLTPEINNCIDHITILESSPINKRMERLVNGIWPFQLRCQLDVTVCWMTVYDLNSHHV